jgi:hypothetical protein
MSDHPPSGGNIPALITILLGIFSKIAASDIGSFMTITVGAYTLYINYPKFKERTISTANWIKTKFNKKKNK